ncbi:6853_t:CDS:1, partial [Paraglomus occultum]
LVADYIPHIRFVDIPYEELCDKFVLYDELLPAKLRHDILFHHLQISNEPGGGRSNLSIRGYKNKIPHVTQSQLAEAAMQRPVKQKPNLSSENRRPRPKRKQGNDITLDKLYTFS